MNRLDEIRARIVPVDRAAAAEVQRRLDDKTKPRRSLGQLEDLASRIAAIRGTAELDVPRAAVVVMGADHGVAEDGVSAYPQEVTRQMLLNFARGGAAINVLARHAGARVVVVDMGVREPVPATPEIRVHRIGPGTANFTRGPAMTRAQATAALEVGISVAGELADAGLTVIATGDMGIGNTTSASALTAAFTRATVEVVTGRGTGIDDEGWQRKVEAIRRALTVNRPDPADAVDVLSKVGGFEIAGIAGVILGGAARRIPVVLDGFITGAAALVAVRLVPHVSDYLIASHRSVEAGHRVVLDALGVRPLLDLDLRLGEGSGAALALHVIAAAVHILREMATFAAAGVSDAGA